MNSLRRFLAGLLVSLLAFAPVAEGATSAQRVVIMGGPQFTYYVDSIKGSDSNNGRAATSAWANLTNVPALKPGQSVGLAAGSSWQGQALTLGVATSAVNSLKVAAYGSGAKPLIDGSATIAPGCWSLSGSFYTCTVTWSGTTFSTPYGNYTVVGPAINVWECQSAPCTPTGAGGNDNYLKLVATSGAVVNGSCFVSVSGTNITLDCLPSDGSNPGTNGFIYTYSKEPYSIQAFGKNDFISGIAGKKNADNNGSIIVNGDGNSPTLVNVEADQGGKHNMFVPGGAVIINTTFVDEYFSASGNMLVGFDGTGSGLPITVLNPVFLQGTSIAGNSISLFTAHTSSGALGTLTISGGYAKVLSSVAAGAISAMGAANTAVLELDNFVFDAGVQGGQLLGCGVTTCNLNNDQYVGSVSQNACVSAQAANITINVTGTKCCVQNIQQGILRNSGNAGVTWNLTNNVLYAPSPNAGTPRALVYGSVAETVTSNGNIFDSAVGLNPGAYDLTATSTYTGDNNSFVSTHASVIGLFNGVQYNTLGAWQTATSQDAHSGTTGSGVSACTLPAGE